MLPAPPLPRPLSAPRSPPAAAPAPSRTVVRTCGAVAARQKGGTSQASSLRPARAISAAAAASSKPQSLVTTRSKKSIRILIPVSRPRQSILLDLVTSDSRYIHYYELCANVTVSQKRTKRWRTMGNCGGKCLAHPWCTGGGNLCTNSRCESGVF
jgi:hypothetical protein